MSQSRVQRVAKVRGSFVAAACVMVTTGALGETLNLPLIWQWGSIGNGLAWSDAITQVSVGNGFFVVLRNNGIVYTGGSNAPWVPNGLASVTQVAAGSGHIVALKSDGTVIAWGNNFSGQTYVPTWLSDVTQVAAGESTSVAVTKYGTVYAWGYNGYGATDVPRNLTGVTQVAAGTFHTVALKDTGSVVSWGGRPEDGVRNVPIGLSGVKQVAAGGFHTVALKSDGTVVAWGYNSYGQTNVPANLTGVTQVAAGQQHTVALKNNGTAVAWGYNGQGQLNLPSNFTGIRQVAAGGSTTIALVEGDCNNDGLLDSTQIATNPSLDLNGNNDLDACEIARGWEEDCNNNGIIDSFEQNLNQLAAADSGPLARIGTGHPQQWVYATPSLSLDDPTLTIAAQGDFSAPGETLSVSLNGRFVGTFYATGSDKNDCRSSISRTITLPRDFYNQCVAAPGGATDAVFDFTTSVAVNADQCPLGSWVRAQITYTAAVAGDCNANSLLDVCEIALDPTIDANTDGVIDACQGMGVVFLCPGDLDGGGSVDTADLSLLLMSFGASMPGDPADLDDNGQVDTADISLMLLNFGPC